MQLRMLSRAALLALLVSSVAWLDAGEMKSARDQHTATTLRDGRILVAGGNSGPQMQETNAELFDPVKGEWIAAAPMKERRQSHAAVLLDGAAESRVLVTGGANSQVTLKSAEIYDSEKDRWELVPAEMSTARRGHTATRLAGGKVLVAGGYDSALGQAGFASAEIFDPATSQWTSTKPLGHARWGHAATRLLDGTVLVVGGQDADVDLASAELYEPLTGTWTAAGTLKSPRRAPTATLLASGAVLVAGGSKGKVSSGNYQALASAELFDPGTMKWTAAGAMHQGRELHGAALLQDGRVLVAGGQSLQGVLGSSELFDPAAGTWAFTDPLKRPRFTYALASLADGRVVAAGGYDYTKNAYPQIAELYDPICAGVCKGASACDHSGNAATECAPRSCNADRTASVAPALCHADSMACALDEGRAVTPCSPLRCDEATGSCRESCASVDDCAPGLGCDRAHRCVALPPLAYDAGGGCSAARGGEERGGGGPAALILAGAILARSRWRRARSGT
jgi:Kelch motif